MKKFKRKYWDGASLVMDVALEILKERPDFGDKEYGALLEEAVNAVEAASLYAHKKSLKKKERIEMYGL